MKKKKEDETIIKLKEIIEKHKTGKIHISSIILDTYPYGRRFEMRLICEDLSA